MVGRLTLAARRALILTMYGPRLARSRPRPSNPPNIKRILIVRPDHLGDLLFATPALHRIRQAFPEAHITGLVGPWGRAIWEGNPNLDSLQVFPFPGITTAHHTRGITPYKMLGQAASKLRRDRYDLGILLRFDHWWGAAMLSVAAIPHTWGYSAPDMATWLTNTLPYIPGRHEVEQNLYLTEAVIQSLATHPKASQITPLQISNAGTPPLSPPAAAPPPQGLWTAWINAPRRAVIHPGTAGANKLWTIAGWAQVANRLTEKGWSVALTGSPDERPLAEAIIQASNNLTSQQAPPIYNIAGQTANIPQLAYVLDQAHIVLGVDSGPLHIADALGKPTLHLYGPSDERVWGPWGDPNKHRAFRAPGTHPTGQLHVGAHDLEGGPEMQAITPDMVMSEAHMLMDDNNVKRET